MHYRTLGRTGLSVSEIGVGGAVYAGRAHGAFNESSAIAAIRTALEAGINYIDTSRHYGPSEEIIGTALTGYKGECIICTKLAPRPSMTVAETVAGVEESLKTLQRPYIDVLLAHDIQQGGTGVQAVEAILRSGGMVDGFRQLQREGRVRFIGVSGRVDEVTAAMKTGEFDVVLSFNRFNLLDWSAESELLPTAKTHNVGVTMGGVFYQGFLSLELSVIEARATKGMFWDWDLTEEQRNRVLSRLGKLNALVDADLAALRQLAIRFALSDQRISVAVLGMKTVAEVTENLAAAEAGGLDADAVERLKTL
jgi:aryl-alcohol dehydrogenase-like predicted oxidoreductase